MIWNHKQRSRGVVVMYRDVECRGAHSKYGGAERNVWAGRWPWAFGWWLDAWLFVVFEMLVFIMSFNLCRSGSLGSTVSCVLSIRSIRISRCWYPILGAVWTKWPRVVVDDGWSLSQIWCSIRTFQMYPFVHPFPLKLYRYFLDILATRWSPGMPKYSTISWLGLASQLWTVDPV